MVESTVDSMTVQHAFFLSLQYRMVFAVACVDKLMIYDTQQALPIGFVSDIHYSSITDLAWYVGDMYNFIT